MNTTPTPQKHTEKEKKRRALLPLLLPLLFLLLATSCIVGFLLGRTTEPGRYGALIDAIVLSPTTVTPEPSPAVSPGPVPSSGPAPSPSPGATGTPGPSEAPGGETDTLIDILGVVRYTDGEPFTQGAVRLRSQPRYSRPDGEGRFRFDGVAPGEHVLTVLDFSGNELATRAVQVVRDAPDDAYIEYLDTLCVLHIKALTVEVNVDLTMDRTPGGLLEITLVGAQTEPQPGVSPTPAPSGAPATSPTPTPSEFPAASPTPTPTASPTPTPTPAPSPSVRPTVNPSDPGTAQVYHGDSGVSWTQQAEIDLFRPLNGAQGRLIAPGSQGYYLFRLENGRRGPVRFTLAIEEGAFHVPLEFRLTDNTSREVLSHWQPLSAGSQTVSRPLELPGGKEGYYRIEWRWPFHGDDGVDTALGLLEDRTYTLKLTIRVEDA